MVRVVCQASMESVPRDAATGPGASTQELYHVAVKKCLPSSKVGERQYLEGCGCEICGPEADKKKTNTDRDSSDSDSVEDHSHLGGRLLVAEQEVAEYSCRAGLGIVIADVDV